MKGKKEAVIECTGMVPMYAYFKPKIVREEDRYHTVLRTDLGHKTHHRSTILFALDGVFRVSVKNRYTPVIIG